MRAVARFISDVSKELKRDLEHRGVAQVEGLRRTARGLEQDLEQVAQAVGLGKLSRSWASAAYPRKGRGSLSASAEVFVKGGEGIQKAMEGFSIGAQVGPRGGRYLASPTNFNMAGGRRRTENSRFNVKGSVRVTPSEMIASHMSFTIKRPGGGLLWMLKVTEAQTRSKRGRITNRLFAGAMVEVGSRQKMRKWIRKTGAVPMYTLLPPYAVAKRFSIPPLVSKWVRQAPDLIAQEYQRISGNRRG